MDRYERAAAKCALALRVASLAITFMALACGDDDNQDAAGARALLERVRNEDYRSWLRPSGFEQRRPTTAPHGREVDLYVNPTVADTLTATTPQREWPIGSTIVKDGFSGTSLTRIAIMDKRPDGWFWAEYDANGAPLYSGSPDICLDCHAPGADYVRAFPLP